MFPHKKIRPGTPGTDLFDIHIVVIVLSVLKGVGEYDLSVRIPCTSEPSGFLSPESSNLLSAYVPFSFFSSALMLIAVPPVIIAAAISDASIFVVIFVIFISADCKMKLQ